MHSTCQQCSSSVDGSTNPDDIAELFADKYKDLYTCVSYNVTEMNQIRCSVEENIIGYDQHVVSLYLKFLMLYVV